jgi:hypothetical protein
VKRDLSRTGTFLTVLSAIMLALSLVAQGTGLGQTFRVFALLVLLIGLLIGLGTYLRLVEADIEDVWLITGMNRIRQAYLQLAPDLDPYFVTSHHDDEAGILQTYSFRRQLGVMHLLFWIAGIIVALLSGAPQWRTVSRLRNHLVARVQEFVQGVTSLPDIPRVEAPLRRRSRSCPLSLWKRACASNQDLL